MAKQSLTKRKVLVAMSGGIDSSVAAAILVQEGYEVIGVTMQMWPGKSTFENHIGATCTPLHAIADAQKVAAKLGIPHYVLKVEEVFRETIIHDFIEEYRRGRTPNPCVRCNRLVKFHTLLTEADKLGVEHIATGHYARVAYNEITGRWHIKRGVDHSKDQSYVLYQLTQDQLARTILPLGYLTKDEVRRFATQLGLPVATKPESQEICFVGDSNYGAFLKKFAPEILHPGPILDISGNKLGEHKGIALYTIGQRRRLGIAKGEPTYVVRIEAKQNAIVVGKEEDLYHNKLKATDMNYVSIEEPLCSIAVTAKVRYNMKDVPALLTPIAGKHEAYITFEKPQRAITPGQSVVCYNGEDLLCGGIIDVVVNNTDNPSIT
jgi:tRNA-specific 2-thiouridylase